MEERNDVQVMRKPNEKSDEIVDNNGNDMKSVKTGQRQVQQASSTHPKSKASDSGNTECDNGSIRQTKRGKRYQADSDRIGNRALKGLLVSAPSEPAPVVEGDFPVTETMKSIKSSGSSR